MNLIAVCFFVPTILVTLIITWWAARRTHGRADYYAAGSRITGWQNGIALSGDLLSASTVLGLTGMFYASGLDQSAIYYVTPPVALCLLLVLVAAPLRKAGRYTLGDVLASRTDSPGMARALRVFSGVSTIVISMFFLVGQLIGAGGLISVLFGTSYATAVTTVGVLMTVYVFFGGMLAATWVQIVKASLLVATVVALAVICLVEVHGLEPIWRRAAEVHPLGWGLFHPGGTHTDLFSALSLGISTGVGSLGLPHLLIRFFTVPNGREAQVSAAASTTIMVGVIILLVAIVSPAAVGILAHDPRFVGVGGAMRGGLNMTAINLAEALGGPVLLGVVSAVALATILAVVAGVVIASASAASHDVYAALRGEAARDEKRELAAFRISTVIVAAIGLALAFAFEHENVSFMIALAMAVAISANVPVLMLTLYWKRLTSGAALAGGIVGLVGSVGLLIVGPSIWVKILGHERPLFASDYPGLFVAPIALAIAVAVSLATKARAPAPAAAE